MRGARTRAAHACVHRSANFLHVSSSTLHGLPEYTLHLCITSTPESGCIDKVATSKSHCFFYSFFTIRCIFSACRVKNHLLDFHGKVTRIRPFFISVIFSIFFQVMFGSGCVFVTFSLMKNRGPGYLVLVVYFS